MATDTYLEMLSDAIMETGLNGGNAPSSIATAQGDAAKMAYWIRVADLRIQRERIDWDYLWDKVTVNMTQGSNIVRAQTDTDGGGADPNNANALINVIDKKKLGIIDVNGEVYFPTWMPWTNFTTQYDYADLDDSDSPAYWSMNPSRQIKLSSNIESGGIRAAYEFWRKPLRLREDTDTTRIPDDFNRLVIVLAKIEYAEHEDAPEVSAGSHEEYEHMLNQMLAVHAPESEWSRMQSSDQDLVVSTP